VSVALRDDILALIEKRPGITDAEIVRAIPGPKSRHQQVNARCRALAGEGFIQRVKPSLGAIGNHPLAQPQCPKGSPRPRAGEKPPPGGAVGGCPAVPPGRTAEAVAPIGMTVDFLFQQMGSVTITKEGLLSFPPLPSSAGIYKLRLPESQEVYVGEAGNLRKRMDDHRKPKGKKTAARVNRLVSDHLAERGVVIIEVCTDAQTTFGDDRQDADLASKTVRVMIEHAAILSEKLAGWTPLNKAN